MSGLFVFLAIGAIISGADAKPPKRIWGGRLATDDEFPGMISLSNPEQTVHTCGGAIIGPRHILTAGHCVDKSTNADLSVRAGIIHLLDYRNVVTKLVTKIVLHPDYVMQTEGRRVQNDIAILVLAEPMPIGGRIKKLMLPTHAPQMYSEYTLAGFGDNHINPTTNQLDLKVLSMTLSGENTCQGVAPQAICVNSLSGVSCGGDSGSPLVQDGHIYGIVSTGRCMKGLPSTFVNVFNYVSWIKETIRQTS